MRFVSVVVGTLLLDLAGSGCHDLNSPAARPEMMFPGGGGGVGVAGVAVTKLFQPMYGELASDQGYVASAYRLLRP